MIWSANYRTVILESAAEKEFTDLVGKFPRFEDVWSGEEWKLSRSPEKGLQNSVDGLRIYLDIRNGDLLAGTPKISVIYTFDDNNVFVHAIAAWVIDSNEEI
jgi:hypothetical protein